MSKLQIGALIFLAVIFAATLNQLSQNQTTLIPFLDYDPNAKTKQNSNLIILPDGRSAPQTILKESELNKKCTECHEWR